MSRFVVIRESSEQDERVIQEAAVPTEAELHQVLMRHPKLVPATDLGLGQMVTVGFETSLASGRADLVLMDDSGRLCLVEVKKEGNPDTRRVIAQVMDYAAELWGMTVEQFEQAVLRRHLGPGDTRSLNEFVVDAFFSETQDADESTDRILDGLSETLRSGDFALVVAAPVIPEGVQRVIEYLNARGLAMFGLEVSYFKGEVEAFVPRVVVRPTVGVRIAGRDSQAAARSAVDADTYLAKLPDRAADVVRRFIEAIPGVGAELQWRHYGPRIRVTGAAGPKVVASIQNDGAYLVTGPLQGIDPQLAQRAGARLQQIPGVNAKPGATFPGINIRTGEPKDIESFFSVALDFVRDLVQAHTGPSNAA